MALILSYNSYPSRVGILICVTKEYNNVSQTESFNKTEEGWVNVLTSNNPLFSCIPPFKMTGYIGLIVYNQYSFLGTFLLFILMLRCHLGFSFILIQILTLSLNKPLVTFILILHILVFDLVNIFWQTKKSTLIMRNYMAYHINICVCLKYNRNDPSPGMWSSL